MKFLAPIIGVVICMSLGFLSGMSTFESIEGWYATLKKPPFNPPNWIFGPVWTCLYLMMGIAVGLIWNQRKTKPAAKAAVGIFIAQFILNLIWTPLFFGMHRMLAALVVIILLWIAILLCIRKFSAIRSVAGWLLVPYLLWVSFATVLNASLWWLNK